MPKTCKDANSRVLLERGATFEFKYSSALSTLGQNQSIFRKKVKYKWIKLTVDELPFPGGLGKEEHKGLLQCLKSYLNVDEYEYMDPLIHESAFYEDEYQRCLRSHLDELFLGEIDIRDVAKTAYKFVEHYEKFGEVIDPELFANGHDGQKELKKFIASVDKYLDSDSFYNKVQSWLISGPKLFLTPNNDGEEVFQIGDGRHRLAFLKSIYGKNSTEEVVIRMGVAED
ncbi:hypothetical protein [Corynebacterium sp. HMSC064E08]|uniref:hypothetical protein n=1 Tax=Corynebacterium sp. HMSC064E08 TaxID=1739324 RepID=UPI0008A532AD|nr:hypothetical protein [Corynebacterium sp. HMSC064E08]